MVEAYIIHETHLTSFVLTDCGTISDCTKFRDIIEIEGSVYFTIGTMG